MSGLEHGPAVDMVLRLIGLALAVLAGAEAALAVRRPPRSLRVRLLVASAVILAALAWVVLAYPRLA